MRITFVHAHQVGGDDLFPPVARELIERFGGRCSAHHKPNGRVLFVFTLEPCCQRAVLVIDDNEGLTDLFRRYLSGEPYRLLTARDGQEGLDLARRLVPDVIVLDVMMPRSDGWEILQQLQSEKALRHIPVLICTVLDDPDLACALGAAGFLAKPVSRCQLLQALASCCQDRRPRIAPGAPADN